MATKDQIPCLKGQYAKYGHCWNVKLEVTFSRGPGCDPTYERWIAGLPGPLKQKMLRPMLSRPETRAAMKRIAEANRRDGE